MIDKLKGMFNKVVTSTITVNGQTFVGNNVSVVNGEVIVDGKKVAAPEGKVINIAVQGDIESLKVDRGSVNVTGSVGSVAVSQGDVESIGGVKGKVEIDQGNLECGDIFGDVSVNMGNVVAGTIHGSVKAKMGNVY